MKFFEKYFPEKRRFRIFAWAYLSLFLILFSYLFARQIWQKDDYLEKERLQGQRRILRPGARGDVLDREHRLLIGNKAHYSAILHLEMLSQEIWKRKIEIRRFSHQIREDFSARNQLSLHEFIAHCMSFSQIRDRGFVLKGKLTAGSPKPELFCNGKQLGVTILKGGIWELQLAHNLAENFESLIIQNSQDLFELSLIHI